MKKILVFMNSFNVGGVTSVVTTIYRSLNCDEFTFDFIRDAQYEKNEIDGEIERNGDKVYLFNKPKLNRIPILNYALQRNDIAKQLLTQIGKTKYDAIYIHAHAHIGLYIAKKLGIPTRIMHVHEAQPDFGANIEKSFIARLLWRNRQRQYNKWATVKAGDSLKACRVKYGENVVNDPKLCVIYPPVDMIKFNPESYGAETDVEKAINPDSFNMIHVGRLYSVKNQFFLIDILYEMNKTRETELYIVGKGELEEKLLSYSKQKGVDNKFHLLLPDTSPAIYRKMNCSLLPSFSEAFGMVAVESQLMGVPCFASTNVPKDVDVGMCLHLELDEGAKYWADEILKYDYENVAIDSEKIKNFDINCLIKRLEGIF